MVRKVAIRVWLLKSYSRRQYMASLSDKLCREVEVAERIQSICFHDGSHEVIQYPTPLFLIGTICVVFPAPDEGIASSD